MLLQVQKSYEDSMALSGVEYMALYNNYSHFKIGMLHYSYMSPGAWLIPVNTYENGLRWLDRKDCTGVSSCIENVHTIHPAVQSDIACKLQGGVSVPMRLGHSIPWSFFFLF